MKTIRTISALALSAVLLMAPVTAATAEEVPTPAPTSDAAAVAPEAPSDKAPEPDEVTAPSPEKAPVEEAPEQGNVDESAPVAEPVTPMERPAPASAHVKADPVRRAAELSGPVARDDEVFGSRGTTMTLRVLDNDEVSDGLAKTLTDVSMLDARYMQGTGPALAPTMTWNAAGVVTVRFPAGGSPESIKRARFTYTIRDNAPVPQTARAVAAFTERVALADSRVVADTNATMNLDPMVVRYLGDGVDLPIMKNDEIGAYEDYALQVTSAPQYGSVSQDGSLGEVLYTVDGSNGDLPERTDTFSYRLTSTAGVTNEVTVTLELAASTTRPDTTGVQSFMSIGFNTESADTVTFDPRTLARNTHGPDISLRPIYRTSDRGSWTDLEDGRWSYTLSERPATTDGFFFPAGDEIDFAVERDGEVVGQHRVSTRFFAPNHRFNVFDLSEASTPDTRDSEHWVTVGQSTNLRPFLNDPAFGLSGGALDVSWVDASGSASRVDRSWTDPWNVTITKTPSHGELNTADLGTSADPAAVANDLPFRGQTVATDTIKVRRCNAYPVFVPESRCSTQTLTIHVTPRVAAEPDAGSGTKGKDAVVVDPKVNDTYTERADIPATVTLDVSDLPGSVRATVLDDQTVRFDSDADAPDSVTVGYRITDYSGSADSEITVDLRALDEPVDPDPEPPVDPPTPETPTPPAPPAVDEPKTPKKDSPVPVKATPSLPDTGGPALWLLFTGSALVLAGSGLLAARKRTSR